MSFAKIWNTLHNSSFSSLLDLCPKISMKGILGLEEVWRRGTTLVNRGIGLGGTSGGLIATSSSEQDQLWDRTALPGAFPVWSWKPPRLETAQPLSATCSILFLEKFLPYRRSVVLHQFITTVSCPPTVCHYKKPRRRSVPGPPTMLVALCWTCSSLSILLSQWEGQSWTWYSRYGLRRAE